MDASAETPDHLFTRLINHYEGRGRVYQVGPDSGGAKAMTRRISLRYGRRAIGLLEIQTVAVAPIGAAVADEKRRQISWTRNARIDPSYVAPPGEERGSRLTPIRTWDDALAAIDGPRPSA